MAMNMFLKFENPSLGDQIELVSWSQQSRNELTFVKYLDATTTELLKLCWSATKIGKATLRCYRDDFEYLVITMQNVLIANYSVTGGRDDVPTDNVTLEYASISYEYKHGPMLSGKPATATFDVKSGAVG